MSKVDELRQKYSQVTPASFKKFTEADKTPTKKYLDSQATDRFEYSLLHMKYIVTSDPKTDIDKIKKDAMITKRIPGLLQFIPRYKTAQNLGKY